MTGPTQAYDWQVYTPKDENDVQAIEEAIDNDVEPKTGIAKFWEDNKKTILATTGAVAALATIFGVYYWYRSSKTEDVDVKGKEKTADENDLDTDDEEKKMGCCGSGQKEKPRGKGPRVWVKRHQQQPPARGDLSHIDGVRDMTGSDSGDDLDNARTPKRPEPRDAAQDDVKGRDRTGKRQGGYGWTMNKQQGGPRWLPRGTQQPDGKAKPGSTESPGIAAVVSAKSLAKKQATKAKKKKKKKKTRDRGGDDEVVRAAPDLGLKPAGSRLPPSQRRLIEATDAYATDADASEMETRKDPKSKATHRRTPSSAGANARTLKAIAEEQQITDGDGTNTPPALPPIDPKHAMGTSWFVPLDRIDDGDGSDSVSGVLPMDTSDPAAEVQAPLTHDQPVDAALGEIADNLLGGGSVSANTGVLPRATAPSDDGTVDAE